MHIWRAVGTRMGDEFSLGARDRRDVSAEEGEMKHQQGLLFSRVTDQSTHIVSTVCRVRITNAQSAVCQGDLCTKCLSRKCMGS
jgi:hypothetical protein